MKKIELKKGLQLLLGIVVVGVFGSGCGKSFLDHQPSIFVSGDQISDFAKSDPAVVKGSLLGMYAIMPMVESGGTVGNQTDFGQKGLDMYTDIITGDMCIPRNSYGWYGDVIEYKATVDNRNLLNYMPWRYYYRVVFAANSIIDALGGNDVTFGNDQISVENRHMYAQALAMRAYAYFYLGQLFASGYEPSYKLCPLYKSLKEKDLPLSTMQDVYDLVVKDLTKAIEYLADFDRGTNKSNIDANVAKGLLAYTYGAMGQYDKVKQLASEVIASNKFVKMSASEIVYNPETKTGSGFNNVNIKGWMWGTDITESNQLGLVSFWGQLDIFTYSYPSAGDTRVISSKLYDIIRSDDVRKGQFVSPDDKNFPYCPANKFYHKDRKIQGQGIIDADYVYMRVSEMYMLEIEALAFTNNETEAKEKLKSFLSDRIKDTSYIDALSGDALKNEIHNQWRIEFWGEGKSLLALRRFKTEIVLGDNRYDTQNRGLRISWDDQRLFYKVPSNEELNNPNLKK